MKRPPRIAIYARYSSDLQNPSSVDDQIALCRDLIRRQFEVDEPVAIFSDASITGSTMARPGFAALMAGADNHEFDLVVAEGLDRMSRLLSDIARIYQILQYSNVDVWTAHEGHVSELHIGVKGAMNELYLKDMKDKVRRGQRARAVEGRSPASTSYGYRVVRGVTDERNRNVNGLREIDPDQAAIVRRIFEDFANGIRAGQIAKRLNDEGVPSPSGGTWRTGSILGAKTRGQGILNNELYRGWLLYGRTRLVTNPHTGRKRYITTPEAEWTRTPVPELRIVSDELWNRVHQARHRSSDKPKPSKKAAIVDRLGHVRPLTGLVKCGWCGGEKTLASDRRYVCSTYRHYRTRCRNARGTTESAIAQVLFSELLEQLKVIAPDLPDRLRRFMESEIKGRKLLEKEAAQLEKRTARLIAAIESGVEVDPDKVVGLQRRMADIRKLPSPPEIDLPPHEIAKRMQSAVLKMMGNFADQRYAAPIRRLMALVVADIKLIPTGERWGETIEVRLKPTGWPEFYLLAHAEWPRVGRQ